MLKEKIYKIIEQIKLSNLKRPKINYNKSTIKKARLSYNKKKTLNLRQLKAINKYKRPSKKRYKLLKKQKKYMMFR